MSLDADMPIWQDLVVCGGKLLFLARRTFQDVGNLQPSPDRS